MSIARRVTMRCLVGTGAAVLALSAGSASAWATGTPGGDGWDKSGHGAYTSGKGPGTVTEADHCQFSLDGAAFTDSVKVDDQNLKPTEDGKVHIKVRAADGAASCTASLASYLAHGPSFGTSGLQVFVDFDTVTVKPGATDTLDIAVPDAGCFGQIDLYRGSTKFDGKLDAKDGFEHGDLPEGPNHPVIKDKLIASWNGGTKDCTTPPESTPPASTPPASTPPSATPSKPAEETPSTSTPTPSASESTTPPAPTPNGGSSTPPGDLAETGGGNTLPIAAGAAALLAAGAGIAMAARRRTAAKRS